ncbi:hypothetical protein F4803DRAFT_242102 [Xylaria telfairii]|nr:hypothetical protein F4803DRAFT_242102 [Xylaria telfairii]
MVLDAAKQLGDYNTESIGRQMLVYRSQDPLKQFDELIAFQKSRQHDIHSCLHTILAKYAVCNDEIYRKSLRDQISAIIDPGNLPITLQEIRTKVLQAVSEGDPQVVLSPQMEPLNDPQDGNIEKQTALTGPRDQHADSEPPRRPTGSGVSVSNTSTALGGSASSRSRASLEFGTDYIRDTDSETSLGDAAIQIRRVEDNYGDIANSARSSGRSASCSSSEDDIESLEELGSSSRSGRHVSWENEDRHSVSNGLS